MERGYKLMELSIIRKTFILIFLFTFFTISAASAFLPEVPSPEVTVTADEKSTAENFFKIKILYKFPEGYHQTHNPGFFRADITGPEIFTDFKITYPEGKKSGDLVNYYDKAIITLSIDREKVPPGEYNIRIKAGYQLCDESGTCYLPGSSEEEINVTLKAVNANVSDNGNISFSSILYYILFAFTGGLLLNVMPCVFPLLSIKALSLVKQAEENKRKILLSSLSYASGIVLSLLILAVFLIILRSAGRFAGWGFQMQNPWFVMALSAVIFIFALSMFDVFTVTLPGGNTAGKTSAVKGYGGHFLTGIFAVLVAAPCTAPFLGPAIAFALSQNSLIILLFFIFIGAGFSLPFIILGFNHKLIKKLPKPGRWSSIFKELLGFILAGTSVYLVSGILKGRPPETGVNILFFFLAASFAAWLYGKTALPGASAKRTAAALLLSAAIIAAGWFFLVDFSKTSANTLRISGEQYSDETGVNAYIKPFSQDILNSLINEKRGVFVDIYADWCTTCKINERFVLSSDEIISLFLENEITLLKGDFTNGDPDIGDWMKENGKAGVPVYAYYPPGDADTEPYFFPEIITKALLVRKISNTD